LLCPPPHLDGRLGSYRIAEADRTARRIAL
jgi:hypothetical protein